MAADDLASLLARQEQRVHEKDQENLTRVDTPGNQADSLTASDARMIRDEVRGLYAELNAHVIDGNFTGISSLMSWRNRLSAVCALAENIVRAVHVPAAPQEPRQPFKRENVLRFAHKIANIAGDNRGVIDPTHDVTTCEVCGRIADLMIDFFTPDPDYFATPPIAEEGRALPPMDVEIEGALAEQRTIFNEAPASSDSTEGRWFYRTLVCLSHMTSLVSRLRAASPAPAKQLNPLLVEHTTLRRELRNHLDTLTITSENIGDLRRSLFVPWESQWNGWVRDETAARENSSAAPALAAPAETPPRPDRLDLNLTDLTDLQMASRDALIIMIRDLEMRLRAASVPPETKKS